MAESPISARRRLRAGDWVEVRSPQEILATLDPRGQLEHMPFMPEMLQFCGRRFRVSKRAHKTCDPVYGLQARRLSASVHLEGLRCSGEAHAGCQAGCLLFWKEAWLKPVAGDGQPSVPPGAPGAPTRSATGGPPGCGEQDLLAGTLALGEKADAEDPVYVCQATQLRAATTPLPWWDLRQYVEDYTSGNARLSQILAAFLFFVYHHLCGQGVGLGSAMRWLYDAFQRMIGGSPYPWRVGQVPRGVRTPTAKLDLQEGERVRIKDYRAILETLDEEWKNRGLYFDGEMVPYTGGTYRVLKRVQRIIHEKTGKMLRFKNDALILENVACQGRYSKCRKLCPRAYYLYWREIWLERAAPDAPAPPNRSASPHGR